MSSDNLAFYSSGDDDEGFRVDSSLVRTIIDGSENSNETQDERNVIASPDILRPHVTESQIRIANEPTVMLFNNNVDVTTDELTVRTIYETSENDENQENVEPNENKIESKVKSGVGAEGKRKMKSLFSESESSEDESDSDTPVKRSKQPKLKFFVDEDIESKKITDSIIKLEGEVVEDILDANVYLIGDFDKSDPNLISSICLGNPIISTKYLDDSNQAKKLLDPFDYVIEEVKEKMEKTQQSKLFENYSVVVVDVIHLEKSDIANMVKAAGGEILLKRNQRPSHKNVVLIYCPYASFDIYRILKKFPNATIIYEEDLMEILWKQKLQNSMKMKKKH